MAAAYVQAVVVVVRWVVDLATWAVAGGEPMPAPGDLVLAGEGPVNGEEP